MQAYHLLPLINFVALSHVFTITITPITSLSNRLISISFCTYCFQYLEHGKFSNASFLFICARYFYSPFLTVRMWRFHSDSLEILQIPHCTYVAFTIFSASFCVTTSLSCQASFPFCEEMHQLYIIEDMYYITVHHSFLTLGNVKLR